FAQSAGNSCRRFDFHQFDSATAATGPDDLIDHVLGPLQSGADSAQTVHLGAERPSPHGHHLEVGLSELEPLRLLDVGGLQLLQLAADHFRLCRTHDFSTARRIFGSTKWYSFDALPFGWVAQGRSFSQSIFVSLEALASSNATSALIPSSTAAPRVV